MITRNKAFTERGLGGKLLQGCLNEHMRTVESLNRLHDLYMGKGEILHRVRAEGLPNNRLSHAFARYIVTVASGYLAGGAVQYTLDEDLPASGLEELKRAYTHADVQSVDMELAKCASLYGRGVELIYAGPDTRAVSCALDPRSAFVVYDESAAHLPLFGVTLHPVQGESGVMQGFEAQVYTDEHILTFRGSDVSRLMLQNPVSVERHYFGHVPMVEYWNNDEETGDLAGVISLMEAYDVLQSDRVNDREQQVDALLLLYGAQLMVDEKGRTPAQQLRQDKLLYLPDRDAGAEYLCPSQTGQDAETLRLALEKDIHKFAMVPDLSDESFSGNLSGIAIKYKLMGLEQLTRMKERFFRQALRERMKCYCHFLSVKGMRTPDEASVRMVFRRTLPVDALEAAQMVRTLTGVVDEGTLRSQLPFMEN